jgi:hypothetical protein
MIGNIDRMNEIYEQQRIQKQYVERSLFDSVVGQRDKWISWAQAMCEDVLEFPNVKGANQGGLRAKLSAALRNYVALERQEGMRP